MGACVLGAAIHLRVSQGGLGAISERQRPCVPSMGEEQAAVAMSPRNRLLVGQLQLPASGHRQGGGGCSAWGTAEHWGAMEKWQSTAGQGRTGKATRKEERSQREGAGGPSLHSQRAVLPSRKPKKNGPHCSAVHCFYVLRLLSRLSFPCIFSQPSRDLPHHQEGWVA